MSSLSRLLKLARRSYGPVFVYDSEREEDYVLISADEYFTDQYSDEDDALEDWYDFERSHMLDTIDDVFEEPAEQYVAWKQTEEFDRLFTPSYESESEDFSVTPFDDVPPPPVHDEAWYTPASVFESYSPVFPPVDMQPHESYITHDALRGVRPVETESLQWEDDGTWGSSASHMHTSPVMDAPVRFEPVPFDPPLDTRHQEFEPLRDSDAPVFYEEPIV